MTGIAAYARRLSDVELAEVAVKLRASTSCFVEGPLRSGFLEAASLDPALLARLWLVRCFDATTELYARRTSFDAKEPWLVRIISERPPGDGWESHALTLGKEQALVLHEGGEQFGEQFSYPGVQPREREVVVLRTVEYQTDAGPSIVRWLRLEVVERNEVESL